MGYDYIMKRGFSLIELLVVITIISILTLVTVSQFQNAKKKSNDVARKGDLNSVTKALQMFYADYGYFPSDANPGQINGNWGGQLSDNASTPYVYMKVLPRENYLTSFPYCYKTSVDLKKYALFAQLENTNDSECGHAYICNGVTYCYGVVSPNSSLSVNGSLQ